MPDREAIANAAESTQMAIQEMPFQGWTSRDIGSVACLLLESLTFADNTHERTQLLIQAQGSLQKCVATAVDHENSELRTAAQRAIYYSTGKILQLGDDVIAGLRAAGDALEGKRDA